jgi:hypothetical protein
MPPAAPPGRGSKNAVPVHLPTVGLSNLSAAQLLKNEEKKHILSSLTVEQPARAMSKRRLHGTEKEKKRVAVENGKCI